MGTQVSELSTAQWIGHIERNLPTEARSRRIVARAIILLTSIRHIPNFEMIPLNTLNEMDMINWPNRRMQFKLGEIIGCLGDFDETAIEEIKAAMLKILDETAPCDSLKEHLAKVFKATCSDNHHTPKAEAGIPLLLLSMATTLAINISALEDFIVTVKSTMDSGEVSRAIGTYYETRGYLVTYAGDLVFAEKDNLSLCAHFTNYTASERKILVTVSED